MIEEKILKLVEEHYAGSSPEVLLLSNLGIRLRKEAVWPPPNDTRSLLQAVEAINGIQVVRDDSAESFIAIVLQGDEARANRAIESRRKRRYLRGLPRAFLLAFTIEIASGQVMTVRLGRKITYHVTSAAEQGTIIVDDELRLPGLNTEDIADLSDGEVEDLERKIKEWCTRNGVDPESLTRFDRHSMRQPSAPETFRQSGPLGSALDRLFAAQPPEVAKRLNVPIDIAIVLSKIT